MARICGMLVSRWWQMKAGERSPHHRQTAENSLRSVVLGLAPIAITASGRLTSSDRIGGIR